MQACRRNQNELGSHFAPGDRRQLLDRIFDKSPGMAAFVAIGGASEGDPHGLRRRDRDHERVRHHQGHTPGRRRASQRSITDGAGTRARVSGTVSDVG